MADDTRELVVDVSGKRLLEMVKAIVKSGAQMESEIIKKFGEVTFTVALKDAESIKSFISGSVTKASTSMSAPAAKRLAAVMPADFDHCRPRRRG